MSVRPPRVVGALLAASLAALPGCFVVNALVSPGNAAGRTRIARPATDAPLDVAASLVQLRSSERSHVSGRNNFVGVAAVTRVGSAFVDVQLVLTSMTHENADPSSYFMYLDDDAGGHAEEPTVVYRSPEANTPFDYTFQYTVSVTDAVVRAPDGTTVATLSHPESRTGSASEGYYTRVAIVRFRRAGLVGTRAHQLTLRVEDVGVNMRFDWDLDDASSGGSSTSAVAVAAPTTIEPTPVLATSSDAAPRRGPRRRNTASAASRRTQ